MNIFDEVQHRLSSKTRIRALFRDVHLEDMERIISRLRDVLVEKKETNRLKEEELKHKKETIAEVHKILASKGLSLSDLEKLTESKQKQRKRRNVHKFTFEYQTPKGEPVRWYGSTTGRLPKDFQSYLEETGKKRLDCVVEVVAEA